MRTVIDGAALYERGLIRARTRAALDPKRARGERVGALPYGLALDADGVRLVPAADEQATIARARELRILRCSALLRRLSVARSDSPAARVSTPV
jgi:DNA invertase Pin-like site-specific DNA recombinase